MDKHDFIDLIKVVEGVLRIEEGCRILTGYGLETGEVTHSLDHTGSHTFGRIFCIFFSEFLYKFFFCSIVHKHSLRSR